MEKNNNAPRRIIFDTDWWSDCDDCVALRLLCRAHAAGEIELIGVTVNAAMEYSAASVSAFSQRGAAGYTVGLTAAAVDFPVLRHRSGGARKPAKASKTTVTRRTPRSCFSVSLECGKCEIVAVGFLQGWRSFSVCRGRSLAKRKSPVCGAWRKMG